MTKTPFPPEFDNCNHLNCNFLTVISDWSFEKTHDNSDIYTEEKLFICSQAQTIDYGNIISNFASVKARNVFLM